MHFLSLYDIKLRISLQFFLSNLLTVIVYLRQKLKYHKYKNHCGEYEV